MQFRLRNFRKGTSRYIDERDNSFSGHSIDRKLVLQLYDDFVCATVLWSQCCGSDSFSVFLFIALFLLLFRKNYTGRPAGRDLIFSAALAFTTILGVYIDHENAMATLNAGEWIVFFLYVSGAIPLFFICITFLHKCAEKIGSAISKSHESFTGKQMIIYCFISSMIILLC